LSAKFAGMPNFVGSGLFPGTSHAELVYEKLHKIFRSKTFDKIFV